MKRASKHVLRLPLEKRAEMAFKEAVEDVIDEHARLGLPLHVWQNGKVVGFVSARGTARFCDYAGQIKQEPFRNDLFPRS